MNISRRSLILSAGSALAAAALMGCGEGGGSGRPAASGSGSAPAAGAPAVELQIFAANSLERALPEVQRLYTAQFDTTFADTQFKASGDLVEQLRAGAAADLLITASAGTMDTAVDAALVDGGSRTDMFANDLVIVRAQGSGLELAGIEDVADVDGRIAIGDARTVPAGKYANQALASVGLYTGSAGDDGEYAASIAGKVALADKVGTAAKYVSTGDCAVGFVYSSDIYRYDGIEEALVCPEDSHKPIIYPGAVTAGSAHAEEAARFLDFCLTDPKAQKVWSRYGFEITA
ncbi:MAG: molybdate ABC transporter substrate-binding protein [Coriobacteriaceae bacterium]|nr:molybdate ABC transporter substrate-binding protein [Coriobacteriaceae bacterium]